MIKKTIILIILGFITFGLAGCNNTNNSGKNNDTIKDNFEKFKDIKEKFGNANTIDPINDQKEAEKLLEDLIK